MLNHSSACNTPKLSNATEAISPPLYTTCDTYLFTSMPCKPHGMSYCNVSRSRVSCHYNTTGCSHCSIMQYKHVVGATADDNRDSLVSPAGKRARTDKLEKAAKKSLRVQVSIPAMFQRDASKEQVSTAGSCLPCLKPKNHPYGHCLWRVFTP